MSDEEVKEMKTANVNCRIREDIKLQAESILTEMGIPRSVAIDIFYRQIIMNNGLPFEVTIPRHPLVREEMSEAQFNQMMQRGYEEAKADNARPLQDVFSDLERGI